MRVDLILVLVLFFLIAPTSQAAAIHEAAKEGNVAAISAALDAGVDINASDGIATPLYFAIDRAHLEAAKFLIARGANVNLAAKWGPPSPGNQKLSNCFSTPVPRQRLSSKGRRHCIPWLATVASSAWWPSLKKARTSMP